MAGFANYGSVHAAASVPMKDNPDIVRLQAESRELTAFPVIE